MGRLAKTKKLNIWMNGELVGAWHEPSRGEAELTDDFPPDLADGILKNLQQSVQDLARISHEQAESR